MLTKSFFCVVLHNYHKEQKKKFQGFRGTYWLITVDPRSYKQPLLELYYQTAFFYRRLHQTFMIHESKIGPPAGAGKKSSPMEQSFLISHIRIKSHISKDVSFYSYYKMVVPSALQFDLLLVILFLLRMIERLDDTKFALLPL